MGLLVYALIVFIFRSQRRAILLSSLLAAPQALFALYLVPRYWNPRLIAEFSIGLEDILFTFICGGMAWVEASWLLRRRIILQIKPSLIMARLLAGGIFALGLFVLLARVGIGNMLNPLIIMGIWILTLLLLRRSLWPFAALAAVQSFVLYTFTLAAMKFLWPAFFMFWAWKNLSGINLWGIPLEEIAWGILYGPFWGTTMAYLLEAKLTQKSDITQVDVSCADASRNRPDSA